MGLCKHTETVLTMADSNSLWEWAAWAFSPASSAIIVTLLVSLLSPLLIHIYLYRTAPSRELPLFLLAGPSGSGKTSLLTLFATDTTAPTHISQEPQTAVCQLPATVRSSADRYRSENDTRQRSSRFCSWSDRNRRVPPRHSACSTKKECRRQDLEASRTGSPPGRGEQARCFYLVSRWHREIKTARGDH